jgi:hypothetical protein
MGPERQIVDRASLRGGSDRVRVKCKRASGRWEASCKGGSARGWKQERRGNTERGEEEGPERLVVKGIGSVRGTLT